MNSSPVHTKIVFLGWQKLLLIICSLCLLLVSYWVIVGGDVNLLFIFLFTAFSLVLYLWFVEAFILVTLLVNQEFFYLFPREILNEGNYQDLLFFVIVITGIFYFFRERGNGRTEFRNLIFAFLFLVIIGIFTAHFAGQPLSLSMKAAKGYYLILFYFIFAARRININRLFNLIIITGAALTILNNIQYIFWGSMQLFYYERELERASMLRFLIGDFFTIFSPLIAFGEYLRTNKKIYLLAFIYMVSTVIVQGQVRSIIFGFLMTVLLLLYLSKKINMTRTIIAGILLSVLVVYTGPMLQKTFIGKLFQITKEEVREREGNVGIRMEGYEYYSGEILKSPLVGRGIWNDAFTENNPQDMKYMGIHVGDLGITRFLFNFGLFGLIWIILILKKIYRTLFISLGVIRRNMHYGFLGYFIFSLAILPSLDCLVDRRTIIYFALMIVLMEQSYPREQAKQ